MCSMWTYIFWSKSLTVEKDSILWCRSQRVFFILTYTHTLKINMYCFELYVILSVKTSLVTVIFVMFGMWRQYPFETRDRLMNPRTFSRWFFIIDLVFKHFL